MPSISKTLEKIFKHKSLHWNTVDNHICRKLETDKFNMDMI